MDTSCQPSDLEGLHAVFPDWAFEAHWTVAGTGPDARYLMARKGDVTLTAWSAEDLGAQVVAALLAAALREEQT